MNVKLNQQIVAELQALEAQQILSPEQVNRIAERYPTTTWDVLVLVRWFTILGAACAGAGVVILAQQYASLTRLGELGTAAVMFGSMALAFHLEETKGLVKTAAALQMIAGFALQGLTTLLAIDFSHGSKNWPALVGVQAALLAAMAYVLKNRLNLIHAAVCFFIFFGGETGYMSGWGAYWLGMTYPVRFLAAGVIFLLVAWFHATELKGAYQSFSRVYGHLGLLVLHLGLWFLAVFGYYTDRVSWTDNSAERIWFSGAWAAFCVAGIWLAGVTGQRMLRSYGLTFLIIDLYTFYFQFIAYHSAEMWWLHLLIVGGSLVWVGFFLERQLREPSSSQPKTMETGTSG